MEQEVTIEGKVFKLKELSYISTLNGNPADKEAFFKGMLKDSIVEPETTDDMINNLTFREGNQLMMEINKLNGIGEDFQKPSKSDSKK